jgi:hypothetical protein
MQREANEWQWHGLEWTHVDRHPDQMIALIVLRLDFHLVIPVQAANAILDRHFHID